MSLCPTCRGEMRPLFSGEFCPKDCDRPAPQSRCPPGGNALPYLHIDAVTGRKWEVTRVPGSTFGSLDELTAAYPDVDRGHWISRSASIDAGIKSAGSDLAGNPGWKWPIMAYIGVNSTCDLLIFKEVT